MKRQRGGASRPPRTPSTGREGQGSQSLGATAKPKPAAKSFAAVVAQWRPEVLAAAQDPDELEVDKDLEAVAAVELLPVEEQHRLRLRHLRKRRQAAIRAGPVAREDAIACERVIDQLVSEARQQRPWPVRAQVAADALRPARLNTEGLRTDLEAARATVAAISADLATAEADLVAAQRCMDAVQAGVGRGADVRPELTPQDLEVIGALRGLVSSSGMPIQALLTALFNAIGNERARAAGSAAGQAPGGGFGGHAVEGAQAYSFTAADCSPTSAAMAGEGRVQSGRRTSLQRVQEDRAPKGSSPNLGVSLFRSFFSGTCRFGFASVFVLASASCLRSRWVARCSKAL